MNRQTKQVAFLLLFLIVMITVFIIIFNLQTKQSDKDEKKRVDIIGNIQFKGKVINSKVYEFAGKNYYMICVQIDTCNVKTFYVLNDLCALKIKNNIATIILNRPDKGNSITNEMGLEIIKTLDKINDDNSIFGVILTGNGKYFCTGMDLNKTNTLNNNVGNIFEKLSSFPKPIICKLNGPVLAGGLGIFFSTDIRIAKEDSYFQFTEVKRGLVPAMISVYIVPQIGLFKAKELMITGRKINAKEAFEWGFLSSIVKNDIELEKVTQNYLNEILENGPKSMMNTKENIYYISNNTKEHNLNHAQKVFQNMIQSEESKYGVGCFIQKKKPNWNQFYLKSNL